MNIATIEVSGVYASAKAYTNIPAGLVGATITFEFADPKWNGLSRTAVFKGNVTRDVIMGGDVVRVPPETVATDGGRLLIGVYGVDGEENIVIPTLWTDIGPIMPAADPSGDPGTDPDLPIWAQLQSRVEALESGAPSNPDSPSTPGRPGEDGGYYTPAVTQPSSDTVEFAFSPSKQDMPAVDPVQVKLPVGPPGKDGAPGADGAPGYTPVRGTDYYTEADKTDKLTLAQMPGEIEGIQAGGGEEFFISAGDTNSRGSVYSKNVVWPGRAGVLSGCEFLESVYAPESTWNDADCVVNCKNLKTVKFPKRTTYSLAYFIKQQYVDGIGTLESLEIGSIGYPVTKISNWRWVYGLVANNFTITVYVDAETISAISADVTANVNGNILNNVTPTIIYRNSTTGEVITE